MRTALQKGYKLKLPNKVCEYEITKLLGKGASCFVYLARYIDNGISYEVILKEYHPQSLNLARDDFGALYIPDDCQTKFDEEIKRFEQAYKKQATLRLNSDLTNSTTNIQGIHFANKTLYIEMTLSAGATYRIENQATDSTLYDFLRRMRSLATVVGYYHKAGYLHLDIKPDNIFAPKSNDGKDVILFDFDSMVEQSSIMNPATVLSYTKEWAAMEQLNSAKRSSICTATDIFSIGEIIFYRIFGRHSNLNERRSYSTYTFDYETDIFRNMNPKVFSLLNVLLKKTLCNVVKNRYQSTEELIDKLNEILNFADTKKPYLINKAIMANEFFIGRNQELSLIHEKLLENSKIFLTGIGGIGKSELAKNYAIRYKDSYDTILFTTYHGNWMMLINNDNHIQIANFERYEGEEEVEYCIRKFSKLNELCDDRTLFIIDNLNEDEFFDEEQERWESILSLNCKIIFTTRIQDWNYSQITLGPFSQPQDLLALYGHYCTISTDQQSVVETMIDYVDKHTLTIELIAKFITTSQLSPEIVLEKLTGYGVAKTGNNKVIMDKDNVRRRKTPFDHIYAIFDMTQLSDSQLYIMANMALIPSDGIELARLKEWCELENLDEINQLTVNGWLNRLENIIKVHPIISEVALKFCTKSNPERCQTMLEKQAKYLEIYDLQNYSNFAQTYQDVIFFNSLAENLLRSEIETDGVTDVLTGIPALISGFGYMNQAIKYQKYAFDIFQKNHKKHNLHAATMLHNLAVMYETIGDFEQALLYAKEALRIKKKPFWFFNFENAVSVASSFSCLSAIYYHTGHFIKALVYEHNALRMREILLGAEDIETLISINNLGTMYQELENFKEASYYIEKALNLKLKIAGEKNISYAISLSTLSTLYRDMGNLEQALSTMKEVLEIEKKYLGEIHASTATTLCNLSTLYYEMGNYEESADYAIKSLEIKTQLFGENNIALTSPLCNLGQLFAEIEDFEQALEYTQQALTIEKNTFGEIHPKIATSLNNIAGIYEDMGKFTEALQTYQQALRISQTLFGTEHSFVYVCLSNIGYVYEKINDINSAKEYYTQAYEVSKKIRGTNHHKTKLVQERLSNLHNKE